MTNRSAVDAIRGYFYQFDMSIRSVLGLTNNADSIFIECIEDIDLKIASDITAVQCKYYAKSEYNHSVIKDAVMHMLSHFKEVKSGSRQKISYIIRGHYASGKDKLNVKMDIEFLKNNFFTYTAEKVKHYHHIDLGLDDAELEEFLALLTIDINALEFDKQFQEIVDQLKLMFNCTTFCAEFFYYNNALRVIRELAIKNHASDREITKKSFLERINTSSILFDEWFVQKKGKKSHLAALRKEYFAELNVSPFERFFLIEINPSSYVRSELKELIFSLSKKWSKLSKREPNSFCPYLFIQGITDGELLDLKNEFRNEEFKFIDGYDYKDSEFSAGSIIQKACHSNSIKIKIINSLSNLEDVLGCIKKTKKIYQFYGDKIYFEYENLSISHVKIQLKQFSDIKEII